MVLPDLEPHSKRGLSIIIVAHNSERTIFACLDSIAAQTCNFPFEIIIVDNGSTKRLMLPGDLSHTRLIHNHNTGFGAGNNLGAKNANYHKLLFINPDTVLEDGFLQNMYDRIQPNVVVTPKIVLSTQRDKINTCGNVLHISGYSFVNHYLKDRRDVMVDQSVTGISGAAFGICSADFSFIGGFDEDFFLYVEDTELSWKIHKAGMKIRLSSDSVIAHDYVLNVPLKKFYFLEKGRIILLRKHFTPGAFLFFLPSLILAEILSCSWLMRYGIGGFSAKAKAYRQALLKPLDKKSRYQRIDNYAFLEHRIPFDSLTESKMLIAIGALFNLLFKFNLFLYIRINSR